MSAPIRIVRQEDLARGSIEPPRILRARPDAFAIRAGRLRALAAGHSSADYLLWMASIAAAQATALAILPPAAPPDAAHLERARTHGLPPLGTDAARDASWRSALEHIVDAVRPAAPDAMAESFTRLRRASVADLERAATRLLAYEFDAVDASTGPLVAAALQVEWVRRGAALDTAHLAPLDVANVCPQCGAAAIASVLRSDPPAPGARYLHCSLCETEWLYPRGQCTVCNALDEVAYLRPEVATEGATSGASAALSAESCEACKSYLKIFNAEKDGGVDPTADDLATLAFDLALDEAGYRRSSPNLLFIPGPA